jgi:hypothetical protein
MAIEEAGGDRWRTPTIVGAGQHRRNFLVPRGMTARPAGEESCDDAVAPKRSRRRRPSGRSAHHQRPFGHGLGQTGEEIKATLMARQERQERHHRRFDPPRLPSGQCATPLPCCLAAHAAPPSGLGLTARSQTTDKIRSVLQPGHSLVNPICRPWMQLPNLMTNRGRGSSLVTLPHCRASDRSAKARRKATADIFQSIHRTRPGTASSKDKAPPQA